MAAVWYRGACPRLGLGELCAAFSSVLASSCDLGQDTHLPGPEFLHWRLKVLKWTLVILKVYKVFLRTFFREGWSSAYLSSDSPIKIALGGGGWVGRKSLFSHVTHRIQNKLSLADICPQPLKIQQ